MLIINKFGFPRAFKPGMLNIFKRKAEATGDILSWLPDMDRVNTDIDNLIEQYKKEAQWKSK